MAIPLEPDTGLFPELEPDAFSRAPELGELATAVIAKWNEFESLRRAIADGLAIAYVWDNKPFDPAKDEYKRHVVAKVTKASPLWECLAEVRLAIQFRRWFWDKYSEVQREAVVYHELRHIRIDWTEDGELTIKLVPHDLEEFNAVARRYGAVLPDVDRLLKNHRLWANEQKAKGEVASIRIVADEPDRAAATQRQG